MPDPAPRRVPQILSGATPDPSRMPSGCRFHPRCPVAFDRCKSVNPPLFDVGEERQAACLLVGTAPPQAPLD